MLCKISAKKKIIANNVKQSRRFFLAFFFHIKNKKTNKKGKKSHMYDYKSKEIEIILGKLPDTRNPAFTEQILIELKKEPDINQLENMYQTFTNEIGFRVYQNLQEYSRLYRWRDEL